MRKDGISYSLDEFNYSIKKSIHEYKEKYENGIETLNDMNLISYEITTNKMLNLCEAVNFNGKNLYVYKSIIEICDSEFINKYVLRDEKGMKIQKKYNDKLIGLSLKGNILDTKNDVVKIKLDIDSSQNKDTAKWFPYSTVYSSEDGTGWYCMPEVGDAIRLYFPDNEEKNAYAISSVNLKSSNSQKRSDPSVKNIGTKYGKQLVMKPGAVEIIGGNNLLMRMTDDGGIEIKSDKKIILDAQDDIEIKGKAKVSIKGDEGVDLTQNSANLAIKDDVKMTGGKVKIE
ncbi:phage baseplate assembly protein V [Clostridium butyricum]